MSEILNSIVSEVQAMRSGKFIPYHKMAAAVALIVTVIFFWRPRGGRYFSGHSC